MSVWRQKAMDIAPELKKDFEDADLCRMVFKAKRREVMECSRRIVL
jgi:hypothetical protein